MNKRLKDSLIERKTDKSRLIILITLAVLSLSILSATGCSGGILSTSKTTVVPDVYESDGTETTVKGVITALGGSKITIRKKSGEKITALIGKKTTVLVWTSDGKREVQTLSAVKVGDQVSAGVRLEGGKQVVVGLGITK